MPSSPQPPTASNRRATPRLEVNGRIQGELEAMNLPVRVRDIGHGGFSIETTDPVEPELQVMRFTQGPWSISLQAWSRYSRPFCGTDGVMRHVTGFEFADPQSPETRQVINALVERLTSVLVFD
jgi:hypothetical protein